MKYNEDLLNEKIEIFAITCKTATEDIMSYKTTLLCAIPKLMKLAWTLLFDIVTYWENIISEAQNKINHCSICGSTVHTHKTTNPVFIFPFGRIAFLHRKIRCSKCGHRESLLRRWIPVGIENRITPMVGKMLIWLSSKMPYDEVKEHLQIFWGLTISQKGIQNYVHKMGKIINEKTNLLKCVIDIPVLKWDRVYIYVDGVMVHINGKWREVKVGIIEVIKNKAPQYFYYAEKTDWKSFMNKMLKISERLNCSKTYVKIFISDAGKGITYNVNIFKDYHFLIDFFHASEHISKWLDSLRLKKKPLKDKYRSELTSLLYKGKVKELVARMAKIRGSKKTEKLLKEEQYFKNHISNFDYATHRQHKWHIGSGKIESACRWLIQQRFKLSGMRWKQKGFSLILGLRLALYNGSLFPAFNAITEGGEV